MSEAAFRLFSQGFSLAAELLYALSLTLFLRPLPRGRGAAVFGLNMALWLLCELARLPPGSLGLLTVSAMLLAARKLGMERPAMLLSMLLYLNARISSGLIAESVYYAAERLLGVPAEPVERIFLRSAALVSGFLLTHTLLLCGMLRLLRRRLGRYRPCWRELCWLGLIPAAGILFGQMMARLLFEVKDGMLLRLYERHPAFAALVPLLALMFYIGAYLTVASYQGMERLREERETYFACQRQTQAIRERIQEVERLYAQIRQARHELRGHLMSIRGLARSGDRAALEAYIAQADRSIGDFELTLQTGNPVTDVIVNDIRRRCSAEGIAFRSEFHYPEAGGYDAFDVGIILQNLLQNALEASGRAGSRGYVALTGRRTGRFFLIVVKNAFAGKVVFGPEGLPATTKADASIHGIGLPSVRREAEKYMGELELRAEGQEFCATVLLQERSGL